jgi:hypothetical protein
MQGELRPKKKKKKIGRQFYLNTLHGKLLIFVFFITDSKEVSLGMQ